MSPVSISRVLWSGVVRRYPLAEQIKVAADLSSHVSNHHVAAPGQTQAAPLQRRVAGLKLRHKSLEFSDVRSDLKWIRRRKCTQLMKKVTSIQMNVLTAKLAVVGAWKVCKRPNPYLPSRGRDTVPLPVVRKFHQRLDEYVIAGVVPKHFDITEVWKRSKGTCVLSSDFCLAAQTDAESLKGPNTVLGKHGDRGGNIVLVFREGMQLCQLEWCAHGLSSEMHAQRRLKDLAELIGIDVDMDDFAWLDEIPRTGGHL
jgi:hypothetical protein